MRPVFSEKALKFGCRCKASGTVDTYPGTGRHVPETRPLFPLNISPSPSSVQTHQLDPAAHYLRLRFLVENRLQVYVPQPEEDVYELVGCRRRGVNPTGAHLDGGWGGGAGSDLSGPRSFGVRLLGRPCGSQPLRGVQHPLSVCAGSLCPGAAGPEPQDAIPSPCGPPGVVFSWRQTRWL